MSPWRKAASWISRGAWRTSMISPLTSSIQTRGFWSIIEGVDHSGSMGYMPNRSRICFDLACMVEELNAKYSQIWLAARWGVWEESKRKLTIPNAWMIPHAQVGALPPTSGEGRLRHKVAVSSRQRCRYSSFKYVRQNASVRWVISSKRACMSLGTCCEVLRFGIASSFSCHCSAETLLTANEPAAAEQQTTCSARSRRAIRHAAGHAAAISQNW